MTDDGAKEGEFNAIIADHRAIAILRALQGQPSYSLNTHVIARWLEHLALGGTLEDITGEVRRLESLMVISTFEVGEGLGLRLTERGADYLERRTIVDGLPRQPVTWPY